MSAAWHHDTASAVNLPRSSTSDTQTRHSETALNLHCTTSRLRVTQPHGHPSKGSKGIQDTGKLRIEVRAVRCAEVGDLEFDTLSLTPFRRQDTLSCVKVSKYSLCMFWCIQPPKCAEGMCFSCFVATLTLQRGAWAHLKCLQYMPAGRFIVLVRDMWQ